MRLTLSLILIAAATLYGASYIQAKAAESTRVSPVAAPATRPEGSAAARARFRAEADRRAAADRRREARTNRLTRSICVGCGGPALPFDPSGGAQARRAAAAAGPAGRGAAAR